MVRDRSLQSPTLSAVLGKISAPDELPVSRANYYYAEAARFESLASNCSGNCKRANQAKAESYKAQARYEDSKTQAALLAQRENKKSLINESKNLEYVETNHSAVVRWLKEISEGTFMAAMMFASLIFVVAFEAGFHLTGTRNGIYIEALSRLGYSVKRRVKRPTLLPESVEPETRNTKQVTRTHTDKNTESVAVRDTDKTGQKQEQELDEMALFYQNAKSAKTGATVCCPNCAGDFRKKTYNQCFCSKGCKDNFWNLVKPERLKAARGAAINNGNTKLGTAEEQLPMHLNRGGAAHA